MCGCVNGFNPIDYQLLVLLVITCYEFGQGVLLVGNYQLVEIDHYQILELVHVPAIELNFTKVLYSSLSYVYLSIRWTHWCRGRGSPLYWQIRKSFFVGLGLVFLADMGLITKWGVTSVSFFLPRTLVYTSSAQLQKSEWCEKQQWHHNNDKYGDDDDDNLYKQSLRAAKRPSVLISFWLVMSSCQGRTSTRLSDCWQFLLMMMVSWWWW